MSEPDQIVSAPEDLRPVRWGLGDAVAGWFIAQAGGAIAFSLVVVLSGVDVDNTDELSLGWIAVAQLGLWFGFIGVPWFAARVKGNGLVRDFACAASGGTRCAASVSGWRRSWSCCPCSTSPSTCCSTRRRTTLSQVARDLTDRATEPIGVILLVLIVGIGAPIAEEIFYRGLLYRSMENRFGTWPAHRGRRRVVFGASHFQPMQFVGLAAVRRGPRLPHPPHGPPGTGHRRPHGVQHGDRDLLVTD